eukprot:425285-Pleurochrysis_carterae.AAC.1
MSASEDALKWRPAAPGSRVRSPASIDVPERCKPPTKSARRGQQSAATPISAGQPHTLHVGSKAPLGERQRSADRMKCRTGAGLARLSTSAAGVKDAAGRSGSIRGDWCSSSPPRDPNTKSRRWPFMSSPSSSSMKTKSEIRRSNRGSNTKTNGKKSIRNKYRRRVDRRLPCGCHKPLEWSLYWQCYRKAERQQCRCCGLSCPLSSPRRRRCDATPAAARAPSRAPAPQNTCSSDNNENKELIIIRNLYIKTR